MEGESSMASGEARVPMGTPAGAGSYKRGGRVKKTGPAKLHKGEMVVVKRRIRRACKRS